MSEKVGNVTDSAVLLTPLANGLVVGLVVLVTLAGTDNLVASNWSWLAKSVVWAGTA